MDTLSKLLGGNARVKMMRLFLFHPEETYEPKDIARLTRLKTETVRRELSQLAKMGLVKQATIHKESKSKTTKKGSPAKRRVNGWVLDDTFPYLRPLKNMLINVKPLRNDEIQRRFEKAGRIKLIIIAGTFLQNPESRLDLLVVGDKLSEAKARNIVKDIEAEVGKELVFAAFKTDEFNYRSSVYDKLIRDVLDYEHERVLDKIGVE